jgi:CheY-like chemotaxis protein
MTSPFESDDLTGIKALIVEDDVDVRELIEHVLSEFGAEVVSACSAAEGLEALTSFLPSVIVTDIHMPVEDGFSFIRRLRERPLVHGVWIPIVAMSGGTSPKETLGAGFCAHLTKPMDIQELLDVVREFGGTRPSVTGGARAAPEPGDRRH